jgi:hypothetical protein
VRIDLIVSQDLAELIRGEAGLGQDRGDQPGPEGLAGVKGHGDPPATGRVPELGM